MELDDFKNSLNRESNEEAQHLTPKIIDQMIERKYYSKMKRIAYPEYIGVAICLLAATFIGLNFYKLDTPFLKATGIVSIFTLLIISIISLVSLRAFNNIRDVNKPFVETLKTFATHKLRFYKLQKVNVVLSYLLLVTIIVLISKLFNGIDVTGNKYFWIFSFTFGYIFLLFYSRWVMKYYKKTLLQTEELLKELSAL